MRRTVILATAVLAVPGIAAAQQQAPESEAGMQQQAGQTTSQPPVAEQCLENLVQLRDQMEQDGFWLSGWRSGVTGYGVAPAAGFGAPGAAVGGAAAPMTPMAGPTAEAVGGERERCQRSACGARTGR